MVVIGVDPRKSSHTATALDQQTHRPLKTVRIDAALPQYRRLLTWARQFSQRRWAVKNARGLGRHLAQWLIARGETVVDVAPTATARVRELSRGGRRTHDTLDAAAAASVAALQGDALPVTEEGTSTVLGLWDERRLNLTQQRTRTINQLHALLRDVLPGGVSTDLTADQAAAALTRIRAQSSVERARKDLARELITDIRALDRLLKTNKQITPGSNRPGPASSTPTPAPAASATPTPPASSPAHGCASSGPAGTTTSHTTPSRTKPGTNQTPRLDSGT